MDDFDLDSFLGDIGMEPSADSSSWGSVGDFDFGDISGALDSADFSGVDLGNIDFGNFSLDDFMSELGGMGTDLGPSSDMGMDQDLLSMLGLDSLGGGDSGGATRSLSDYGNFENLLTPDGVDESGSSNPVDYGEGWVRNLTDESQDYATDTGNVKYYDDGRVETFGDDGRYVNYTDGNVVDYSDINDLLARTETWNQDGRYVNYTDGNVVDYSNINDPKAPVETWNKDGRYVNYTGGNVVDYSNIKNAKAPVVTSNADGTKTIYQNDKVYVQGTDGKITEITKIIDNTKKINDPKLTNQQKKSGMDPMSMLMLMMMLSQMSKGGGSSAPSVIPQLSGSRTALPYSTPSRPGAGGQTYFSPMKYTPKMASGGITSLGGYSDGGQLLKGPGDGVSDSIPATIGKHQPARLADGEFVVPARIVSELGNGSTDAGARKLYAMMKRIEKTRKGAKDIAANTKSDRHLPA